MDWYYAENNQQKGPVSDAALSELASTGAVHDATLVWHAGLDKWQPYSTVRSGTLAPPAAGIGFCSECGRQFPSSELVLIGGRSVCAGCKQTALQQIREGTATISGRKYAGFWIRAAAFIIDALILGSINVVLSMVMLAPLTRGQEPTAAAAGAVAVYLLLSVAIGIAYEAWFLVNKGATPGKLVLGLRVICNNGNRITWGLAIGRYFGRTLSSMILFIGFLMVAWDEQKRALHDRICDTRVVEK